MNARNEAVIAGIRDQMDALNVLIQNLESDIYIEEVEVQRLRDELAHHVAEREIPINEKVDGVQELIAKRASFLQAWQYLSNSIDAINREQHQEEEIL